MPILICIRFEGYHDINRFQSHSGRNTARTNCAKGFQIKKKKKSAQMNALNVMLKM